MAVFAGATLAPALLIGLGAVLGGYWALAALLAMTLLAAALDLLVRLVPEARAGQEFPAADGLSVVLACVHFVLLPLAVLALSGGTGIGWGARGAVALAAGMWFGQVSNSNAHELIHRTDRRLFRLGMWVYISLLFGHHTSAHRLVHHPNVGLDSDPNTARKGEGFYHFALRAWRGSFVEGLRAETARRQGRGGWHPYRTYALGALAGLALVWALAGGAGLAAWLALASYAQMQLLLSDYVQHYGLARPVSAGGRPAPVGPELSWNAPHWFTTHLMLNAPRHSDHHAHPARPYPALRLAGTGAEPMLPASLPAMAALAMVPPLWKRVMHPRLAALTKATGAQG
ncbi:alkane 1-monooxygenase [Frigidibacter sp. SLM-1]|nr:alkane 1-monooxygenase [Frigidibacter sp. ROC022]MCR8725322.1 alkane 1-monooxygenase [Frigidibacter sp. ROC022]